MINHKFKYDITLLHYVSYEDVPQLTNTNTLSSDPYHTSPGEVQVHS